MDIKKVNHRTLLFLVITTLFFFWLLYQSGLLLIWTQDDEYGHGLMVLGVLGYFIYRDRDKFQFSSDISNWAGVFLTLLAMIMFVLGEISGIAPIRMYSTWLFATGIVFSVGGWKLIKELVVPLGIIFLLIPLPNVLGPLLTSKLQLLSSVLGVWIIRIFGGVVFLEGNVIDMGSVKLMVAEACAGLRYLFPLMSIGAIAGYVMNAPVWMRWAVFLMTIPITIFMNSFRIAVTGLLTDAYGISHTEGFLHFFEGWVVFVLSLGVLLLTVLLMIRALPDSISFSEVFSLADPQDKSLTDSHNSNWQTQPAVFLVFIFSLFTVIGTFSVMGNENVNINNKPLSHFPKKLGVWTAKETRLPVSMEVAAGADDYYHGYFSSPGDGTVNLYISYYLDQKKGAAPHSPNLCIPGDGWKIKSDKKIYLNTKSEKYLNASRLLMEKNGKTTIAYYWVKQGSNSFSQQFAARMDLIRFAITENRADAALIRMITEVDVNEKISDADIRMKKMANELMEVLPDYIPD